MFGGFVYFGLPTTIEAYAASINSFGGWESYI